MKSTELMWAVLNDLAGQECSCTSKQRSGEDCSLCPTCEASVACNEVASTIQQHYRDMFGDEEEDKERKNGTGVHT